MREPPQAMTEELYRILVEAMDDTVSFKDADGRFLMVNSALARREGRPREGFIGMTLVEMDDTPAHRESRESDLRAIAAGRPVESEYTMMTPTGAETWQGHKIPVRDERGKVTGLVSVSRNVTEKRRVLNALRQSEAELLAIFDGAPMGISLVDADGRILKTNLALEKMLGYTEMELVGRHFGEVTYPEDLAADDEAQFERLLAGAIAEYHTERRYVHKEGRAVWGRTTVCMVRRAGAQEPVFLGFVEKIAAPQAMLVQWEKMASIGQLAAGVAHEINNPIGFINSNLCTLGEYLRDLSLYVAEVEGNCQTIASNAGGEAAQLMEKISRRREELEIDYVLEDLDKLVAESVEGSQRVARIVQDLKTFARADGGDVRAADINSILDSALNIVWNQLKYSCTVTKDYGDLPEISCNPNQLAQVFVNMLVNAGQAIEEGKKGQIGIKSYAVEDKVRVEISDNGKGIPPENLKRIFDPFFTTKPIGQGTGLGLSISYNLIEHHGGKIHVTSAPGKGATFRVELPAHSPSSS